MRVLIVDDDRTLSDLVAFELERAATRKPDEPAPATVAAIGSIVIAGMVKAGYPERFAAGVIANAGTLGILIPPSIVMLVYSAATEVSAARMFMAGFIPGLMMGGYNASKAAVATYTEVLWHENLDSGVQFCCVCPPAVATPLMPSASLGMWVRKCMWVAFHHTKKGLPSA